jgi:hypothetical protein
MDLTEGSETLANINQTLGKHPKVNTVKVQCVFVRLCFSDPATVFTTDTMEVKEQRICIKYGCLRKKTAVETHRMLQEAFTDNAMSQSKTFLQHQCFKDGRTSVDNNERSG